MNTDMYSVSKDYLTLSYRHQWSMLLYLLQFEKSHLDSSVCILHLLHQWLNYKLLPIHHILNSTIYHCQATQLIRREYFQMTKKQRPCHCRLILQSCIDLMTTEDTTFSTLADLVIPFIDRIVAITFAVVGLNYPEFHTILIHVHSQSE